MMSADRPGDPITLSRLYGRSIGKPLRQRQQHLIDELLPALAVPQDGPITAASLFDESFCGGERLLHFEIGIGAGEHLITRARTLPDHGFIGAEPYLNGIAQALTRIADRTANEGPNNVRLHHGDALEVLDRLPDRSLSAIYLLHPDPWPKARHAKRRMMNDGPVRLIANKLRTGGEFRFGTDHPIYLRHALMVMRRFEDVLEWAAAVPTDWQHRPADWPETRYEAKARRDGHEVWYFVWRRI